MLTATCCQRINDSRRKASSTIPATSRGADVAGAERCAESHDFGRGRCQIRQSAQTSLEGSVVTGSGLAGGQFGNNQPEHVYGCAFVQRFVPVAALR
jgi:hypothetical protein